MQTIEPHFMSGGVPVAVFTYHENETAYWLTEVTNAGPVDIRIDGLVPPPAYQSLLVRPVGLRLLPPGGGIDLTHILAFRPVTLHAGQRLPLVVILRIANCRNYSPHTSEGFNNLTAHYTVFGVLGMTQTVQMAQAIAANAPAHCSEPHSIG